VEIQFNWKCWERNTFRKDRSILSLFTDALPVHNIIDYQQFLQNRLEFSTEYYTRRHVTNF